MKNRTHVSPTQVKGWCDYKVQSVVKAVMEASDEELRPTLEDAVFPRLMLHNFLALPFTRNSVQGQRLQAAWNDVKLKYPHSAIVREFVWKFWNPHADTVEAHFMDYVANHTPVSARDAVRQAFSAAGVGA